VVNWAGTVVIIELKILLHPTTVVTATLLQLPLSVVTIPVLWQGSIFLTLKKEYSEIQSGGTGRDV
jgi:hypothetical protein